MNKLISIIGNNNHGLAASDGGRIKIRLYSQILQNEGFTVQIVDLADWKKNPLFVLYKIYKAIKLSDVVILMPGSGGSRILLPVVAKLKKRGNAKLLYSPIGIGTISKLLKKHLDEEQEEVFLSGENFYDLKDNKIKKALKCFDLIMLENKTLINVYEKFYQLQNLKLITNFRIASGITHRPFSSQDMSLKAVFLARITESKGIFDAIWAVKQFNESSSRKCSLDIYGPIELNEYERNNFYKCLSDQIVYKGVAKQSEVKSILSQYDCYIFPVKSHEGTPGSLIEAMIAGTPAICSSIAQISEFVDDKLSGLIFKFGSREDLLNKIIYYSNLSNNIIQKMSENTHRISMQYTYEGIRESFLSCFK